QPSGQNLLGARAPVLVHLEAGSHRRHSRDRDPLASRGLPLVLEPDLQNEKTSWQESAHKGNPRSDIRNGGREPNLGCSSDSWRASHWWVSMYRSEPSLAG